ncbi:MAG: cytochrome c [Bacteroidetes bacterium]|nr:MAG: cytochrome c [Bacteroidota bacterium]
MNKQIILVFITGVVFAFFSACGGSENSRVPESIDKPVIVDAQDADILSGEEIYKKTCVACHQANGEGIANAFPPLAKSDFLSDRSQVIHQVINGKTGEMTVNGVTYNGNMPPQNLTDEEIAAVLTYVYSSWGNSGAPITSAEVGAVRSKKI